MTAIGLFLYYLNIYFNTGFQIIFAFLYFIPIIILFLYIAKIGEILSIMLFPLLGYRFLFIIQEIRIILYSRYWLLDGIRWIMEYRVIEKTRNQK